MTTTKLLMITSRMKKMKIGFSLLMMMTMMKKNMKRKITKIFKCKNKIKLMRTMKMMRKMMKITNWRLKLKE